ncbi:anthranilate synthase component 1 [Austwickia chelonae]|nr:anthranilate synthase component 1 [Austwickia chelonae]
MTVDEPAYGQPWPDRGSFRSLCSERPVTPVVRRLLADAETPVGIYRKLSGSRPGTFLLESAEHGGTWSRYSLIGVRSRTQLTEVDGHATWSKEGAPSLVEERSPVTALQEVLAELSTDPLPGLPPLTAGFVGYIGYDAVRHWEEVPTRAVDDLGLPEMAMMLVADVAVMDHADASLYLVANVFASELEEKGTDRAYDEAIDRLDQMTRALSSPTPSTISVVNSATEDPPPSSTCTRNDFLTMVDAGKEAIRAGEVFQVVLSQRFSTPCPADALDVYRVLRTSNPSPYMYLLRLQDGEGRNFDVVGSSPEALVKVKGRRVVTHPIAGSRPRGNDPREDERLAVELAADPKERSEHVMLVDLSRNDLQKVCDPGTVDVVDLMSIRRYSHIMHLESTVVGRLRENCDAYDVLAATFPAGTLSGAPKPRAMALIDELEPVKRGVYGGVVGYLDVHGDMDTAIAIRTAVVLDGYAHVQAGAGVVADSDPEAEYTETVSKAAAALRAVSRAMNLGEP